MGPQQRKAAAALVQAGVSVSLSLELNKNKDEVNVLPFEHQLRVEMFGGQKVAGDVLPSGMTDRAIPLHELVLAGMGMPIFDNLDLDAAAAQAQNRWVFLFVAATVPARLA